MIRTLLKELDIDALNTLKYLWEGKRVVTWIENYDGNKIDEEIKRRANGGHKGKHDREAI